jgi:hypothetical protein
MSKHFQFDTGSWQSNDARIFAEELSHSSAESRSRVGRAFGLTLSFDAVGLRVDYDGRKIGFGSFNTPRGKVTFSINPKVDDVDLKALFNCIEKLDLFSKIVEIKRDQEISVHDENSSFSWTVLLGLLDQINDFGLHHFSIFNSKKILRSRSSIIGRPIAKSLVLNLGRGKFGIDCEVLDNYRQRQYATLFLATGKSVFQDLNSWCNIIGRSNVHPRTMFGSIDSKLKPFADVPFSMRLVTELSHPPYSYGVKSLVAQCVQYWRWKGMFASSNGSIDNGSFWSVSIALDKAFELYAGQILKKALYNFDKLPKNNYSYSFDFIDKRFPKEKLSRSIEPDHIYVNSNTKEFIVAEIKYSNNLAIREHVSQLISYLSYSNYPFLIGKKIGLLVYPGDSFNLEKIPNFEVNIFLLTIPVSDDFIKNQEKISTLMKFLTLV